MSENHVGMRELKMNLSEYKRSGGKIYKNTRYLNPLRFCNE